MVKYPYASYVIDKVPHYKVYYVECPGCGVQGVSDENKKKAISNFRDWWKRFQEAEEKNKKKKA